MTGSFLLHIAPVGDPKFKRDSTHRFWRRPNSNEASRQVGKRLCGTVHNDLVLNFVQSFFEVVETFALPETDFLRDDRLSHVDFTDHVMGHHS